jgi:hypothetical protein
VNMAIKPSVPGKMESWAKISFSSLWGSSNQTPKHKLCRKTKITNSYFSHLTPFAKSAPLPSVYGKDFHFSILFLVLP